LHRQAAELVDEKEVRGMTKKEKYRLIITICPYRKCSETMPSATVPGESFTQERFMPCLKEKCPAFDTTIDSGGTEKEICRRLLG
jgi:hypothetical protein